MKKYMYVFIIFISGITTMYSKGLQKYNPATMTAEYKKLMKKCRMLKSTALNKFSDAASLMQKIKIKLSIDTAFMKKPRIFKLSIYGVNDYRGNKFLAAFQRKENGTVLAYNEKRDLVLRLNKKGGISYNSKGVKKKIPPLNAKFALKKMEKFYPGIIYTILRLREMRFYYCGEYKFFKRSSFIIKAQESKAKEQFFYIFDKKNFRLLAVVLPLVQKNIIHFTGSKTIGKYRIPTDNFQYVSGMIIKSEYSGIK